MLAFGFFEACAPRLERQVGGGYQLSAKGTGYPAPYTRIRTWVVRAEFSVDGEQFPRFGQVEKDPPSSLITVRRPLIDQLKMYDVVQQRIAACHQVGFVPNQRPQLLGPSRVAAYISGGPAKKRK